MKKIILKLAARFYLKIEPMINYFRKDAYIHIDYIYDSINGELIKNKDSFQIYVCQKGKCQSMFSRIDWREAKRILETLKNSTGSVQLFMGVGIGTSDLIIPKWAKSKLIEQLEKEI